MKFKRPCPVPLRQAPPTEDVDRDMREERKRRAAVWLWCEHDPVAQAFCLRMCAADPSFWFENFAHVKVSWRTGAQRAYHKTATQPAMLWPFLRQGMALFLGREGYRTIDDELFAVVLAASREVGKTENAALWVIWDWQFNRDANYGFISRKQKDVDNNKDHGSGSIFSFIRWAIRQQPRWLRPPPFRVQQRHRFDDNWLEIVNPATGSSIIGSSTVIDAMRGDRRRRVVVDEANMIPEFEDLLESLDDVGPVWAVSSVRGRGTGFARAYHGELGFEVVDASSRRGRRGWLRLRWHYSDRPDRKPGTVAGDRWREATMARKTPQAWAQEQEISFEASLPGRIWASFDRRVHVYDGAEWRRDVAPHVASMRIIEGWDFGSGPSLTAVVWIGYLESTDTAYVLDYRSWADSTIEQVEADVAAAGYRCRLLPGGTLPHVRVGDRSGAAGGAAMHGGRKMLPVRSWIHNLRESGVSVRGVLLDVEEAIDRVRRAIDEDRLLLSPLCAIRHNPALPSLADSVAQYHRAGEDDPAFFTGDTPRPAKDVHSHLADALQHACWEVWKRNRVGN